MSTNVFEKYDELDIQKKKLESDLADVKIAIRDEEEKILSKFTDEGISSVKTATGATLWLDHKLWASAGGRGTEALANRLEANGHEELVKKTVNRNSLSAWVRELAPSKISTPEEVNKALPIELQDHIKVTETNNIRVRRS